MIRFEGRNERPTRSGLYPSTNWRYCAERKNAANMAAAHSTPTTSAVARLRSLNSASGTSGELTVVSMYRKTRKTASDTPSRPSVSNDVQPFLSPLTIA